jgi:hypothetical protein
MQFPEKDYNKDTRCSLKKHNNCTGREEHNPNNKYKVQFKTTASRKIAPLKS